MESNRRKREHRNAIRLLRDFLLPHLEQKTFGRNLCWLDRGQGIFQISWVHQSSSRYSRENANVFIEWARLKNLWQPDDHQATTKAKQRFRAALMKLSEVSLVGTKNNFRIYQMKFGDGNNNSSSENLTFLNDNILKDVILQSQAVFDVGSNL